VPEKPATWRRVQVPSALVGAGKRKIREWARSKLNGQEADLKQVDIEEVNRGTRKEVLLKPKKAGFFLPSGEFVEALGPIKLSEDVEEADRNIELRERDNMWTDEECNRFKQPGGTNVRALWEHGQRIAAYVDEYDRPLWAIHKLLAKRGGKDGYSLHAHQTASHLFEWRPHADTNDPIFKWTWEVADAVVKFSKQNHIRDLVATLIEEELKPHSIAFGVIAIFLRGPKGRRGDLWQRSDPQLLGQLRDKLKTEGSLEPQDVETLAQLLSGGRR
jgi:hypothetical protein